MQRKVVREFSRVADTRSSLTLDDSPLRLPSLHTRAQQWLRWATVRTRAKWAKK